MNCKEARLLLDAYVDGEVSPAERREVDEHLASCESCRVEVEETRSLASKISALPRASAPREFKAQIMSRIEQTGGARSRAMFLRWSFAGGAVAAAAAILLVFKFAIPIKEGTLPPERMDKAAPIDRKISAMPAASKPESPAAPAEPRTEMTGAPAPVLNAVSAPRGEARRQSMDEMKMKDVSKDLSAGANDAVVATPVQETIELTCDDVERGKSAVKMAAEATEAVIVSADELELVVSVPEDRAAAFRNTLLGKGDAAATSVAGGLAKSVFDHEMEKAGEKKAARQLIRVVLVKPK